jgi:hypothetical protein
MKKKMVHGLPIPFTHATPIDHSDVPLLEIIYGKNLPLGCLPSKKGCPQRNLSSPNTLQWEAKTIITAHDAVEGFNSKQLSFGGDPPQLVFTFLSHSN